MTTRRQHLKNIMYTMHQHSSQFRYLERRPMNLTKLTKVQFYEGLFKGDSFFSDCSETITAIFKWAKFKDPNGLNYSYNGAGNSETMLSNLRRFFHARFANVGTIVHFSNPDHVAVVYKASRIRGNPLLWEHGAPGIAMIPLSEERLYHNGRVIFLSIAKL